MKKSSSNSRSNTNQNEAIICSYVSPLDYFMYFCRRMYAAIPQNPKKIKRGYALLSGINPTIRGGIVVTMVRHTQPIMFGIIATSAAKIQEGYAQPTANRLTPLKHIKITINTRIGTYEFSINEQAIPKEVSAITPTPTNNKGLLPTFQAIKRLEARFPKNCMMLRMRDMQIQIEGAKGLIICPEKVISTFAPINCRVTITLRAVKYALLNLCSCLILSSVTTLSYNFNTFSASTAFLAVSTSYINSANTSSMYCSLQIKAIWCLAFSI